MAASFERGTVEAVAALLGALATDWPLIAADFLIERRSETGLVSLAPAVCRPDRARQLVLCRYWPERYAPRA